MIAPPLTGSQTGPLISRVRNFKVSAAAENAMAK